MINGNNILNLGCLGHCDTVATICIEKAGDYIIEYELDGAKRNIDITIHNDQDNLILDMNQFPVNREIIFRVISKDDYSVLKYDDYEYIKLKSSINLIKNNEEIMADPNIINTVSCFSTNTPKVKIKLTISDILDNGQTSVTTWDVPGLVAGNNYNIQLETDISALVGLNISEKVIADEKLQITVINESGNDGISIPELTYNIFN